MGFYLRPGGVGYLHADSPVDLNTLLPAVTHRGSRGECTFVFNNKGSASAWLRSAEDATSGGIEIEPSVGPVELRDLAWPSEMWLHLDDGAVVDIAPAFRGAP